MIEILNNLLKGIRVYDVSYEEAIEELFAITDSYCLEEMMEDIVSDDVVNYLSESKLQKEGWQSVAEFVAELDSISDGYYRINEYGVLENITLNYLECLIKDVIKEIKIIDNKLIKKC